MNEPQTVEESTALVYGTSALPYDYDECAYEEPCKKCPHPACTNYTRKEEPMNESQNPNENGTSKNSPYVTSARWQSKRGFEYITTVRANDIEELFTMMEIFETEVESIGGNPLVGSNFRNPNTPLPSANDPSTREAPVKIDGIPVVDGQTGKPVTVPLGDGLHLFHVKEVFKDTGVGGGEPKFKVVIEELDYEYSKGKWGITMLKHSKPEQFYPNWKTWEAGKRKAPAVGAEMVIVKDPGEGQNLAEAVEFRAE